MTDDFYILYVLWDAHEAKEYPTIVEYRNEDYNVVRYKFAKAVFNATKGSNTISITLYRGEPIPGAKILMRYEFYGRTKKGGEKTSLKGKGS